MLFLRSCQLFTPRAWLDVNSASAIASTLAQFVLAGREDDTGSVCIESIAPLSPAALSGRLAVMLDKENELQEANARVAELTRALQEANARVLRMHETDAMQALAQQIAALRSENVALKEQLTSTRCELEDQMNMAEIDEEMRREPVQVSSLAEPGFVGLSSASIEELDVEVAYENQSLPPTVLPPLRQVVAAGCPEYKEVESAFMQTLTNHFVVITIERIQNSRLWDVYEAHKNTMVNDPMRTPDFRPQWWRPAPHQRAAYDVERKWCVCVCVVCVCVCVCVYRCVCVCLCVCTCVCMYVCMYVFMYLPYVCTYVLRLN